MLIILFLSSVLNFHRSVDGRGVPSVKFQTNGVATTKSYIDGAKVSLPDMSQWSVCTHVLLQHVGDPSPLLSYFADDTDGEIFISLNWKRRSLSVLCCGMKVKTEVRVPLKLYVWHHFCVSFHLEQLSYSVIFDDVNVKGEFPSSLRPLLVRGGGRFVIGQDLDSMEGGFSISQTFHGFLSDYQIFNEALSQSEMSKFLNCQLLSGDIVPIVALKENMTDIKLVGDTQFFIEPSEDLCDRNQETLILFPEKSIFADTLRWCRMLKGNIYLPENRKENVNSFKDFVIFDNECVDNWGTLYWLGLTADLERKTWVRLTDKNDVGWSNFSEGWREPSESSQCVSVGGKNFPYEWFSSPCDVIMCSLCSFPSHPRLRLRGLCKQSLLDKVMFIWRYRNGRPALDGEYHSSIFWDGQEWVLGNRRYSSLVGKMENVKSSYPFGIRRWNIIGDKCDQDTIDILITACSPAEYTCNDGSCILKDKRCDLIADCEDTSDELNCERVIVPKGYSTAMPPPKTSELPHPFSFSINITSIKEFSLVAFKVCINLVLSIKWKDARLKLMNLRPIDRDNKIKDSSALWLPKIAVYDESNSPAEVKVISQNIFVEKKGFPLPDDDSRIYEDVIYSGSDNVLTYHQEQTVAFTCVFQLSMYPLDIQKCTLKYYIEDLSEEFGVLFQEGEGVSFSGSRNLMEYELEEEKLLQKNNNNISYQEVILTFSNSYGYYIITAFIPSILTVLICYFTFFFDVTDFQDRIMVSLTSLLVLAALFSHTSQNVPNTSYIKLIDVWYMFLIIIDFLIVSSLVFIENIRLKHKNAPIKVLPKHEFLNAAYTPPDLKAIEINRYCYRAIPTILFLFVLCFMITASVKK